MAKIGTGKITVARGGFLSDTYREAGIKGCLRKIFAAAKMSVPLFAFGRRTNSSVGAYFDLITDDARMFYGDNFHFGYFKNGTEDLKEAHENHTDLVAQMANIPAKGKVLDIGCGVCAPAIHIAKKHDCRFTCINISSEQVRQGRSFVEKENLTDCIDVREGNARKLDFDDSSFDSILCLEVAGDICVTNKQKEGFVREMHRVLKPGGYIGFSDLVFTAAPNREEDGIMQMILYHKGAELITDWAAIFERNGFRVGQKMDIIKETMKTWDHSLAVYEERAEEVDRRYGKRIAERTREQLRRIPAVMQKYGSFVVMSLQKTL